MRWNLLLILCVLCANVCRAGGDHPGEEQPDPKMPIPPAPALSPEDALKTFKLPPGFRIEIAAADPIVQDPICMQWDADGKLYVVEMLGYMQDTEGKGEDQPVGRIVVLEDTKGDGHYDKSTVFLDKLVMPRALMLARDGVLVAEPPKLWFCRDTEGDGKCHKKQPIVLDYGAQGNPEHTANSLTYAMDNWIYSADWPVRLRWNNGKWDREATISRGQYGLSQDDYGRLFYNSNSDNLRADLIPSQYLWRNPSYRKTSGTNVKVASDQSTWPIRVNPGVNRGYQKAQLREDGTLATFTACCGPCVYRGENFPADFKGNVFVCEPAGNLVKRNVLVESDGNIVAHNGYDKAEFLASTDERFRPVNAYTGPDGALYIVDLYRGILQHRIFMTTFLKKQVLARGLDKNIGLGRIYRIVHEGTPLGKMPKMSKLTSSELVAYLSHANGWYRDTAQRLLVERSDADVVPALKDLAKSGPAPLGRLHALWTLDGMGKLDQPTLLAALDDKEPKVAAAAIRLCETLLKTGAPDLLAKLVALSDQTNPDIRLQLALTLSEVPDAKAEAALEKILRTGSENVYVRDAAISGLQGRELEFLKVLTAQPEWKERQPGKAILLGALSQCVLNEHKSQDTSALLQLIADQPADVHWRQLTLIEGMLPAAPPVKKGQKAPTTVRHPVRMTSKPAALATLLASTDAKVRSAAERVDSILVWPDKPGAEPIVLAPPLTADQQASFDRGKTQFMGLCATCHQPTGMGQEGKAPSLIDSDWVLGSEHRLARLILNGMHGPITINGATYNGSSTLEMPAMKFALDDGKIADVLTYIRREWDHQGAPIDPQTVGAMRKELEAREEAWTEKELKKTHD